MHHSPISSETFSHTRILVSKNSYVKWLGSFSSRKKRTSLVVHKVNHILLLDPGKTVSDISQFYSPFFYQKELASTTETIVKSNGDIHIQTV